jgi:hypothetical protein
MKKQPPSVEHVETLSLIAMRRLVGGLVEELHALKAEVATLRSETKRYGKTMPSFGSTIHASRQRTSNCATRLRV